jgi:hypothetical protein
MVKGVSEFRSAGAQTLRHPKRAVEDDVVAPGPPGLKAHQARHPLPQLPLEGRHGVHGFFSSRQARAEELSARSQVIVLSYIEFYLSVHGLALLAR